ncbi:TPA: tRNA (adenosine(37)-N6)-dimethylallyltransferase MiaA [Candidatus Gracilibacteria bacterium]|nr:tRNA (adenosine(37)-N6)-dimethylallyltransferase MiaA [Candidatus Peregrinibacteria bacterium]HIQ56588.1 tRNA (adenosine(37)-N6)-dimethylallyltransferase MiaA [Candidatus Gracilibacteria bacterium]HIQ57062.1 tRNA (adenosine(37)-N6)-dimethylallyltransferase MiaA [Candidatus Gracilibacteria bacterium]
MWNYQTEIYNWLQDKNLGGKNNTGIIVITGPTASGKTGISIEIAQFLKEKGILAEIINADSRQIYTDLPITVAVPTQQEREGFSHHLFEYISPDKTYNVAEWRDDVIAKITEIQVRKSVVIICGGTGLWIDALTKNFTLGVEPNEEFRKIYTQKTEEELYAELLKKDKNQAEKLGKNKKYLIRALEICEKLGNKTDYAVESKSPYNFFMMGVTWEREKLYERINQRNEIMFEAGFLEEADAFAKKFLKNTLNIKTGYKSQPNLTDINNNDCGFIAHGIPEYIQFRNGELSLEELKDTMKQHTRNYAKRQLTWWRKDKRVRFLNRETGEEIDLNKKSEKTEQGRGKKNTKFLY